MAKKLLPFTQVQQIWERDIRVGKEINLELDLETYKKIINILHVGAFYYWVLDVPSAEITFISPNIINVLGYTPEEFTTSMFFQSIHPDDVTYFLNFENKISEFFFSLDPVRIFKYKVRSDFRIRKKSGDYIRILHQVITLQTTENAGITKSFGIHTDISELKLDGTPSLSIIGMDGEPSYLNIEVEKIFKPTKSLLTEREKEVLSHIINGKNSGEIAQLLGLSKHTILNHRHNILAKTETANTTELIIKTIKEGWI
jgi:DNA-binding CsgD family transcriptional regulator